MRGGTRYESIENKSDSPDSKYDVMNELVEITIKRNVMQWKEQERKTAK